MKIKRHIHFAIIFMIFAGLFFIFFLSFEIANVGMASFKNINYTKDPARNEFYSEVNDQGLTNLPYFIYPSSTLLSRSALVYDGMIVSSHSDLSYLSYLPWGGENNKLLISEDNGFYSNNTNYTMPFLNVKGTTGERLAGFITETLNYTGKYISLIFGNISSSGDESFSFFVKGKDHNYVLFFTTSHLDREGWINNKDRAVIDQNNSQTINTAIYQENIKPYSSRLIDLRNLSKDTKPVLDAINILVEPNTVVHKLEFRTDLNKTTSNPPLVLGGNNSYFVDGNITYLDNTRMLGTEYVFDNFTIQQQIDLKTIGVPMNSKLVDNGWNIISISNQFDDQTSHTNNITLRAQRQVAFEDLPFSLFSDLNFYTSLIKSVDPKVWLLILIPGTLLGLYFFRKKRSH